VACGGHILEANLVEGNLCCVGGCCARGAYCLGVEHLKLKKHWSTTLRFGMGPSKVGTATARDYRNGR
jgi:hypothetical protein